ncbi:beta-galactosidase [Parapedobacter sp. ISTM3]|uniref:Beta-galactosidase n=1 Tax=Parapedobacter luteus TaxID=623280 RepID=A0A1T5D8J7_9SPHI|nr:MULTISPECIES: beta-galactosidase [Parapedobacter]MBK1438537.1 beta-galactosidase [Parapedobacter sp. ISTM3]SKB68024.1 beta-galactosidase [Parapedobacter luteus]
MVMRYGLTIGWGVVLLCNVLVGVAQHVASVRMHQGVPTLFVDDSPYPPYAYMSYLGEPAYYREAAQAGVHLYNIPAYLGDRGINSSSGIKPFRKPIWIGEETFDYASVIHDFEEIIAADTQALAIIRIHLDPPVWWEQKYPESACLLPDGTTYRNSFYSPFWQEEAGKVLSTFVRWLLESEYADHLVGIHVAGGFTEEWMYHFKDEFYDDNPARLQGFRTWLRERYRYNVDSLRQAWNEPRVTFETAMLADISGRTKSEQWRHADTSGRIFDTFAFHGETMADHVAYFCRIVKETSKNRLLTGAFYGYHYFVSDLRRGHGALSKLLRCPELDYLSSPNDYNRVSGEDWPPFAAIKSVQLHGKLWLAENDTRTAITTMLRDRAPEVAPPGNAYTDGVWVGPQSMDVSVSLLWKNLGRMLAYGYGGWWFDMWGGWFSDPRLMHVIESGQRFFNRYPDKAVPQMKAEVAVVVDEQLGFMDASFGKLTGSVLRNRYPLGRMGAPYDLYLRDDLDLLADGDYRVVWLMGVLTLTAAERKFINAATGRGAWVIWTDGHRSEVFQPGDTPLITTEKLQWEAAALNDLLRRAGVHCYVDGGDDVVYAGRGWLCIHSLHGGKKTLRLPFRAKVIDPEDGQVLAEADTFAMHMPPNTTRIFRIEPSNNHDNDT